MTRIPSITLLVVLMTACAAYQPQPGPQPEPRPEPLPESAPIRAEPPAPPGGSPDSASSAPMETAFEPMPSAEVSLPEPQSTPPPTPSERAHSAESPPAAATSVEPTAEPAAPPPAKPAPEASQPSVVASVAGRPQQAAEGGLSLSGRIEIRHDGRVSAAADTSLDQTVVAWRPMRPVAVQAMPPQRVMTRQSRFYPQTLAVTSGTEVAFPNFDSIQHNVFSITEDHQFDVGLYGPGESESSILNGLGMVELFCNEHPNMAAFILVLDTPFFTSPDADGYFQLDGLPPGEGELLVWNYRSEDIFQRTHLSLASSANQQPLVVNVTRPTVPQHTNKHGEAYSRRRR